MRLSKRQLKRIIREEYSRLKRRGLIKESMVGPAEKQAVQSYCDQLNLGKCEVISCDDGLLNIPLVGFEDVRVMDMQDLRTQIEGISGDLVGECEEALADYFASFDTLICIRDGQLMSCPAECWQLLPSAVYAMGQNPDGTMRPGCRFKMMADMCENLGTIDEAMAGGMMESRRRRGLRTSLLNESAQSIVDMIVQDNIVADGPKTQESFYSGLVRSGSLSDFEAQVKYSPSSQPIFRDFLGDCEDHSLDPEEALGYVREKYAIPHQMAKNPKTRVKKWYGGSV